MELESPIRYILSNLHLIIISTSLTIESAKNEDYKLNLNIKLLQKNTFNS